MRILRYGDAGLYVRYLQLALARAGYDDVQIDGVFGAKTLNAVTDFQKVNGSSSAALLGSQSLMYLVTVLPSTSSSVSRYCWPWLRS